MMATGQRSVRPPGCSSLEWEARVDLAALYRISVHYGWTDLTYTHISARVPDEPDQYLINPYSMLFDEITASSLVKVNYEGKLVGGQFPYNKVGHSVHTAVLQARPEINYVLHSHTRAGVAVSAMQCKLLPISQPANVILGTLAYHSYAIVEEGPEEQKHLVKDLGDKYLMVLHNHGLLACGRTAAEAFLYHYFLETACEIQVDALRAGQDCIRPSDAAVAGLSAWGMPRPEPWGAKQWAALIRMIDRKDPSFKT